MNSMQREIGVEITKQTNRKLTEIILSLSNRGVFHESAVEPLPQAIRRKRTKQTVNYT